MVADDAVAVVFMKVRVDPVGSVWPAVHRAMRNVPADERAMMSGKEYDLQRDEWYVEVSGQWCMFE
jgi:hypothetical protein